MLEFDINRAVEITYSGAGAAFVVLAFLIVFTVVIGRIARLTGRSAAARGATPVVASAEALSQALVVASIDMTPDVTADMTAVEATGAGETKKPSATEDWKNYGRLEAFLSRALGRRNS